MVVLDSFIKGVVVHTAAQKIVKTDAGLLVEAGAKTSLVVRQSVDWGFTGLEYFLGGMPEKFPEEHKA